jgi:nitrosocyanin
MDQSERRVVGSLLLLSGITFFIIGLHTGQLTMVLQIVESPLRPGEEIAPLTAKEFTVEAFEYTFDPLRLSVKKGSRVKITIKNTGSIVHNFVIDEFNVSSGDLNPGESAVVEFTADQSGSFAYYCSIPGHRDLGMEGKITVET